MGFSPSTGRHAARVSRAKFLGEEFKVISSSIVQTRERGVVLPRKVHMLSICGSGMAPLALLFKEAGVRVTGSDLHTYPPMGNMLVGEGIVVRTGYKPEHVDGDVEVAIVGNAIRKDNPEVQEIVRRGIAMYSLPQALARFFLTDRVPIVVVGTHGKTTSSALLAWVLFHSMQEPGFLVGGVPISFGRNSRLGTGPYFVVEGDEYDSAFFDKRPKFLHYMPQVALFTSLEYDHADIYPTFEELKLRFLEFVRLLPSRGSLFVCGDYSGTVELARECPGNVETYGFSKQSHWRAEIKSESRSGVVADFYHVREKIGTVRSPLSGRHNMHNALGIAAICLSLGISFDAVAAGIECFQGVRKRQELIGYVDGVTVISDFAHHPTAVRETIRAVKGKYGGGKVCAVFEPRTHTSRRSVFQEDFVDAFEEADVTICSGVYEGNAIPAGERFSPERLVEELRERGKVARWFSTSEEIIDFLAELTRSGDIVLIMSSGHFDNLPERLVQRMSREAGENNEI